MSAKSEVKWTEIHMPGLLEQMHLCPFDEREQKRMFCILGKTKGFSGLCPVNCQTMGIECQRRIITTMDEVESFVLI